MNRRSRVLPVVLAAALLPACDLEEAENVYPASPSTASPASSASWETLPIEGVVDGIPPRFVLLGDLDADGDLDLLLGRSTGVPGQAGVLSVYLGAADGTFPASPDEVIALPAGTTSGVLGDFDSDDLPDLVTASIDGLGGGDLSLWIGQGNGDFDLPFPMLSGIEAQSLSAGDFDGDDDLDLLALRVSAVDRIANVSGVFVVASSFAFGALTACGDLRPEPGDEIALVASGAEGIVEIRSDVLGAAALAQSLVLPGGLSAVQIAAADADGDGDLDLLVAAQGGGAGALILFLRGAAGFGAALPVLEGDSASLAARLDQDGDGIPDLALHRVASVALALGAGGGSFADAGELGTASFTHLLEGPVQGGRGTLLAASLDGLFLMRRPP